MATVTFPSSYLTERLKLGDATTRAIKKQFGRDDLKARESGLALSFAEDRALTAVQMLFAFQGLKPQEQVALTPPAQESWGCADLPVMVAEVKAYCRSYAQGTDVAPDVALGALKALACKSFYLGYADAPSGPLRYVYSPVLAVQKYKMPGTRRPTHLRFALTPVLTHGVYPEVTGFRQKSRDLHGRLLSLAGSKSGRPPEQLLRLTAWLLTLTRPTVSVTDQKLAERLRSQTLQHSQVAKFRRSVEQHFEAAKQLGLLKEFKPPAPETDSKWLIKLK